MCFHFFPIWVWGPLRASSCCRSSAIKCCSKWIRDEKTRTSKRRLFRSRRLTHFSEIDDLIDIQYNLYLVFYGTKAYSSTEAKAVRKFGNELKDVWILEANWQPLMWLAYDRQADPACCKKYLNDNEHNCLHLTSKICSDIWPWTLSVPRTSQFPSSFAL